MREETASKKLLIFGIDSFSGRYIKEHLCEYDIYGTSHTSSSDKVYKCDITSLDDIEFVLSSVKPDYILHLAAISFVAHGSSEEFYRVNTIGTLNILNTLIKLNQNPKKIILASSATVYGDQGKEILDESMCPTPANHYGASKYAMESMAKAFFDRLNIIITRPFNYTGKNQELHFLIPKIVSHYKDGKKEIELGNIDVSREFNDIEYVAEVYKRLLISDKKSIIVNIASSRAIKLSSIIDMMNEIAGYDIKININQKFVRKDDIKILIGSNKKLTSLIGDVKQKEFKELLGEMFEA
jgi:nucleoside-diphosphate-sugar epimerase